MVDKEIFNRGSSILLDCLRSCFIVFPLKAPKEMPTEWNEHTLSKNIRGGPSGRPVTMYSLPHHYNCQSYPGTLEDDDTVNFLVAVLTLSWRRSLSYRNQTGWTGFSMITATVMNELRRFTWFFSKAQWICRDYLDKQGIWNACYCEKYRNFT